MQKQFLNIQNLNKTILYNEIVRRKCLIPDVDLVTNFHFFYKKFCAFTLLNKCVFFLYYTYILYI